MSNKNNPDTPEPQQKIIICKCGCTAFESAKVHRLAPGDESGPVIFKGIQAWRCAGCGNLFMPNDLPQKGDEEQPAPGKLILPDDNKKLKLLTN